ncbi:unnamed protein product [Phytomonas sp. Hart1]|nr:unnamed protein product [Phytomonas sp. Hart1]|eukprot:CCW68204.1 unnamed protein product [Phytomonas sp. isolate Hart1]
MQACCCFALERAAEGDPGLQDFIAATKELIHHLGASIDAELIRMKYSLRLKEEFLSRLDLFYRSIAAAQARKQACEEKIAMARQELLKLEPEIALLLEHAKADRDLCLKILQSMFPDRQIMIVGDINKYI